MSRVTALYAHPQWRIIIDAVASEIGHSELANLLGTAADNPNTIYILDIEDGLSGPDARSNDNQFFPPVVGRMLAILREYGVTVYGVTSHPPEAMSAYVGDHVFTEVKYCSGDAAKAAAVRSIMAIHPFVPVVCAGGEWVRDVDFSRELSFGYYVPQSLFFLPVHGVATVGVALIIQILTLTLALVADQGGTQH
jgi:hypothetical protein